MTPNEFYEKLQTVTEPSEMTLSPGPLVIKVNEHDAMASRLILWLQEQMPDEATVKDLFDVLDAAHWWASFWTSLGNEVIK
jgi:hypothetical protein